MIPSGWQAKPLGEISELTMGFAFKSSDFVDSGVSLVRMGNLYQNQLNLERNPVYLPDNFLVDYKRFQIQSKDILISMTGTAGKQDYGYAVMVPSNFKPLLLNQRVTRVRAKKETSQEFLLYAMRSPAFTSHIYSKPGGTKQANISIGDLAEISIALPPKFEQEKIAKILSTWDEAIEKLDAINRLISGLKQNLLHQVIYKNQTHQRVGWSLRPVSELFDILDHKRKPLNSSQRQNMNGEIPYYGANGQVGTVDNFIFDEPLILLAEDGGYFDEYRTRPIAYRISGKSWVNNHAHVLKAKKHFSFDYLYFALVHKNIMPFLNGGTRAKLNKAVLEEIEVPVPNEFDEQVAIANLFNSIEQREGLLKRRTSLLQHQKQGLMQQLLTGKKRVKV